MKTFLTLLFLSTALFAQEKQQLLWHQMEEQVTRIGAGLDGVMGVAILDLTDGQKLMIHADEVFPTASTIKLAVLAELYRQEQQASPGLRPGRVPDQAGMAWGAGRARLKDIYVMNERDLVLDSQIMAGLTPGVTRVTNRDLATFMVAVSDNSATNVLIDRVGMENVNALLDSLGLKQTRLRRKMIDLKAAEEGRENVATPREIVSLLEAIYRGRVFNKALTDDFFKVLSTRKQSPIPRDLPDDVVIANKPGELEAVRNDCGIVFAKNRPFGICVMTTYLKSEQAGADAISRVAAAAFSYFDRLGRASPYGRVISLK